MTEEESTLAFQNWDATTLESTMEVKDAVRRAKDWALDVMGDETLANLGLEEVEFDDDAKIWKITLGFSRPWNSNRNALSALTGEMLPKRAYRTFLVNDSDGTVTGMKRKLSVDD